MGWRCQSEHGVSAPSITVSARSLGEFLAEDLAIAERAISDGMTDGDFTFVNNEHEELDDLAGNRDWYISHLGEDTNYCYVSLLSENYSTSC